jgi:hypothetical protein
MAARTKSKVTPKYKTKYLYLLQVVLTFGRLPNRPSFKQLLAAVG